MAFTGGDPWCAEFGQVDERWKMGKIPGRLAQPLQHVAYQVPWLFN